MHKSFPSSQMIKTVQGLKAQIASILEIEKITMLLTKKISPFLQNNTSPQQALFQVQPLLVEIETLCLLLWRKKHYIVFSKLKTTIQNNKHKTDLKNMQKALSIIINHIKELTGERLLQKTYLQKTKKQIQTIIIELQQNLDRLYKTCTIIQNILTISIHNMYKTNLTIQHITTNQAYYFTKNTPESTKGTIVTTTI